MLFFCFTSQPGGLLSHSFATWTITALPCFCNCFSIIITHKKNHIQRSVQKQSVRLLSVKCNFHVTGLGLQHRNQIKGFQIPGIILPCPGECHSHCLCLSFSISKIMVLTLISNTAGKQVMIAETQVN